MSDKPMTPDEYLRENPTHMLRQWNVLSFGDYVDKDGGIGTTIPVKIDWTGYTEPHVMIGPEFPQSRKREVEWGNPFVMHTDFRPIEGFECRQLSDCEGAPTNIWQWGKYIDKPVKPEPELSRFLPDGWAWDVENFDAITREGKRFVGNEYAVDLWHEKGLLHPSEGGGFQKHTPGDPMPCDGELRVDVIDAIGHIDCGDEADAWIWDYLDCQGDIVGWRPHHKEKN
jgi:hypothetical protein